MVISLSSEDKEAQESLRQSEEKCRGIIKNAPIAIYEVDFDGSKIRTVNSAVSQWLGYSEDESLAMNPLSLLGGESKKKFQEMVKDALTGNKTLYSSEFEVRAKNGQSVWGLFHAKINFKNGKPDTVQVFAQDITERKKIEVACKESEERFQDLVESTSDWIWQVDQKAIYKYVSPKVKEILGYDPEEVLGKTPFDLMPKQTVVDVRKAFEDLSKNKKAFVGLENWNIHKNGKLVLLETSGVPILDQDGNLVGYRGIDRDITERKKADEAIRQNEKRLQNIINAMDDGIVLLGLDGRIIDCNQTTLKQYNLKREEIIGKEVTDFIVSTNQKNIIEETRATLQKTGKARVETQIFRKDYSPFFAEISLTRFYDENNSPVGLLGVARDITERKEAEDKLQEAQAKLQVYAIDLERLVGERTKQLQDKERLAAIGQTAGMVGHDIRNPLQAIVSELYLARQVMVEAPKNSDTAEVLESINLIQEQVEYINKIVSDLQDFARPLNPEYEIVNLPDLLVIIFDATVLPETIKLNVDVKGSLKLKTDPTFIRRALTNLVNNAVQAMPDGGELGLIAHKREECIVISVSDTGQGIPEHVKVNLFKPLMTTKAKGQGLGLAVVKRLVEALNGKVSFESEEGKGTKFTIELPSC